MKCLFDGFAMPLKPHTRPDSILGDGDDTPYSLLLNFYLIPVTLFGWYVIQSWN